MSYSNKFACCQLCPFGNYKNRTAIVKPLHINTLTMDSFKMFHFVLSIVKPLYANTLTMDSFKMFHFVPRLRNYMRRKYLTMDKLILLKIFITVCVSSI